MSAAKKLPSETFQSLQMALDQYFAGRAARIEPLLKNRLGLKECFEIQKRFLVKDIARNPINALWAIPYFSIRKIVETSEKLGWDTGASYFSKVPSAFKTDFQKEIERMIYAELFGLPTHTWQPCELTAALEQSSLKKSMNERDWQQFLSLAHSQVRTAVSEFCAKQNGFTDLAASGGLVLISEWLFKDRSLDIFAIGRKIASLWAKNDAASHFAFGKTLGKAFYSVAPPPPPTTTQVVITTGVAILLLAVFSTAIGILSYPLQRKLGFRQRQLEGLVETVNGKLLVELTKGLKKSMKAAERELQT